MHALVVSPGRLSRIAEVSSDGSTNLTLKQRIIGRLLERRDRAIKAKWRSFQESPKFAKRTERLLQPILITTGAIFILIFLILLVQLIVGLILFVVGYGLPEAWLPYTVTFVSGLAACVGICFITDKIYSQALERNFRPLQQDIISQYDSYVFRLDTDPAFLIRYSREYCQAQISECLEDLRDLEEEFTATVEYPLKADEARLEKWQDSVKILQNWDISEFPSKEQVLADAKQKVIHYQQLVDKTAPLVVLHKEKENQVRVRIDELRQGIELLQTMETNFTTIDTVLSDLERENTQIDYREAVIAQRVLAAQRIGGMVEEKYNLLLDIQEGVIDMAKDLPEPDNFSLRSRPIPVSQLQTA